MKVLRGAGKKEQNGTIRIKQIHEGFVPRPSGVLSQQGCRLDAPGLCQPKAVMSPPDDLVRLLAEVAIAGPATSALRSLRSISGYEGAGTPVWLRDGAARMGWSYQRLFNQIESIVLVRGEYRDGQRIPYWRQILRYALEGGLTAVNDEYLHMLVEVTAARSRAPESACGRLVEAFEEGVALPASCVEWDEFRLNAGPDTYWISTACRPDSCSARCPSSTVASACCRTSRCEGRRSNGEPSSSKTPWATLRGFSRAATTCRTCSASGGTRLARCSSMTPAMASIQPQEEGSTA